MPQIDPDGVLPQQDKIFISKPFRNLRFHLPQYNGYKTAINDIIRVRRSLKIGSDPYRKSITKDIINKADCKYDNNKRQEFMLLLLICVSTSYT